MAQAVADSFGFTGSSATQSIGLPTDWVEVGFGSLLHYQEAVTGKDISRWQIFNQTPGAVQVLPFPLGASPDEWRTSDTMIFPVDLPEKGYRALLGYIAASFARAPNGAPILEDTAHGSAIYDSSLAYSYLRFCHTWALQGLKAAGLPTQSWLFSQDSVKDWFRIVYRTPEQCRTQDDPPALN